MDDGAMGRIRTLVVGAEQALMRFPYGPDRLARVVTGSIVGLGPPGAGEGPQAARISSVTRQPPG